MKHFKSTKPHIKERKQTKTELKGSEELFYALVTASSEIVYLMNSDWSEMLKLYGRGFLANTEKPSRTWLQKYILPEDQPYLTAAINKAIRIKGIFELEHRVRKADGSVGWILSRAIPIMDENGEITEWLGTVNDTAERKRTEEAVQEKEKRYHQLFETMTEGFAVHEILLDEDGKPCDYRFLDINPAFEKLTGLKRSDLIGKRVLEVLPNTEKYWIENYGKVALTGEPLHMDNYSSELDRWYDVIAYRTAPKKFAVIFTDITERKKSEEAVKHNEALYHALASNLPNGAAFLFDKELRFILAEGEAIRKAGFTSQDFEGKSIWNAKDSDIDIHERELDLRRAFEGKPFCREHSTQSKHYVTYGVPVRKENGEITSVLAVSYDITERVNAEAETRQKEANQAFLLEFGDHIRELNDPEEIMKYSAEKLGQYLKVSRAGYVEIDDSEETAMNYEWTDGTLPSTAGIHIIKDHHPKIVKAYLLGGVWKIDNVQTDPRPGIRDFVGSTYNAYGIRATLAYPLLKAGRWVALIFLHSTSPRVWKENEIELIKNVAERTWEAVKRGRAEAELKKSQEQYRILFNSINEGFACYKAVYDENGTLFDLLILDINPAGARLSGVEREAQIGKTWREIWHEVGNYWFEAYSKVDKTGESLQFENFSNISRRWYSFQIDKIGKGLFAAAFRDITERKESEEALKKSHDTLERKVKERTTELEKAYNSLLENQSRLNEAQRIAHIGNWERNLLTDEIYWSDEVYRIFGLKPQEFKFTYDIFFSYVHPEDKAYVRKAVKKSLQGNPLGIDYRIIASEGKERTVHEEVEVVFDEKNTPIRMRGTVQDITERKKTEKFLASLENVRKKEIHHRIKNNLQVVSSLLDLQAEKFSNRQCIESSEVLEAFRESQNRVISVALIHEELHAGGEMDKLNFSLYLQKLVKSLFQTYRLEGIDISSSIRLQENVFFDMDIAIPLGIIVNELITNSLKYAFSGRKTGEIQIEFFSQEFKSEDNKGNPEEKVTEYTLIISDDGVGISKDIDFENLDTLGLQLVKLLTDQLDGKIELEKDHGTRFIIRFNIIR